jgi:hypothetical protein
MDMTDFIKKVKTRFEHLNKKGKLYRVQTEKNDVWDKYLASFPEGTNPLYKERTEHDCNVCRNFIRDVGNVVALKDGKIYTLWDVDVSNEYEVVAKALDEFIKSKLIDVPFAHALRQVGNETTRQLLEDGSIKKWNHFHATIPGEYVRQDIGAYQGDAKTNAGLFQRGLENINREAIDIVLELINQDSLYRGEEKKAVVVEFSKLKTKYDKLKSEKDKNIFIWENINSFASKIKNDVIGSLLLDISEGYDLDDAVKSFESKVAPLNYKRPKAIVTQGMIDQAMKTIESLNIEDSLKRRFAVAEDLSINDVIFSDAVTSVLMKDSLRSILQKEVKSSNKDYSKVDEISIEDFIKDIIPKTSKLEVMVEGKMQSNLMSLTAPAIPNAPRILKWDNNFAWSYNGDITDSIKERVKQAGGSVEGVMRTSLSWFNFDDLDIHLEEPGGYVIYYGNRGSTSSCGGKLDVDMNAGGGYTREAVENIIYSNKPKRVGWYKVKVHNFSKRETTNEGFVVQVEFNGTVKEYSYRHSVKHDERITVVDLYWDGNTVSEIKVGKDIEGVGISKEIWGINTEQFHKVNILTLSPNHWEGEKGVGNKHYFFILDKCQNPESTRGFYNEFLSSDLEKHKKVFEVLGSKLRCQHTEKQLSGLGFSSTKRDSVLCKVSGNFNRTLRIQF